MSNQLTVEQYSEKAIVVRGNTQPYKDSLSAVGGKWNAMLKGGGGWIFPNSKRSVIDDLNQKINSGEVAGSATPQSIQSTKPSTQSVASSSTGSSNSTQSSGVSTSDFLNLLARVESLEQVVRSLNPSYVPPQMVSSTKSRPTPSTIVNDDSESEQEAQPVERLMRKKKSSN